jgi:hypothetical protein
LIPKQNFTAGTGRQIPSAEHIPISLSLSGHCFPVSSGVLDIRQTPRKQVPPKQGLLGGVHLEPLGTASQLATGVVVVVEVKVVRVQVVLLTVVLLTVVAVTVLFVMLVTDVSVSVVFVLVVAVLVVAVLVVVTVTVVTVVVGHELQATGHNSFILELLQVTFLALKALPHETGSAFPLHSASSVEPEPQPEPGPKSDFESPWPFPGGAFSEPQLISSAPWTSPGLPPLFSS